MHTTIPTAGAKSQESEHPKRGFGEIGEGLVHPPAHPPAKHTKTNLYLPLESGESVEIPMMTEGDYNILMETLKLWKTRLIKSKTENPLHIPPNPNGQSSPNSPAPSLPQP